MNRTALRIATVAALLGGGNEPYPTIAGAKVHDSRMDPLDDIVADERQACIVVRTDEDRIESGGSLTYGTRAVTLRIGISIVTAAVDPDTNELYAGWPETDNELEAFLDLLEFQVGNALLGFGDWAVWWRDRWDARLLQSLPAFSSPENGRVKLAARDLTFTVQNVPVDCYPEPLADADAPAPVPNEITWLLENVFDKIAADGGGDFKTAMAALKAQLLSHELPKPGVYPMLESVRMTIPDEPVPEGETPANKIDAEVIGDLPTPP